jgi:hypothetical protein
MLKKNTYSTKGIPEHHNTKVGRNYEARKFLKIKH